MLCFIIVLSVQCKARQCTHHTNISNLGLDSVMIGKDGKSMFHSSYHVTAIKFLLVGIIITTGTLSVLRPLSLYRISMNTYHVNDILQILITFSYF
jgi:hypothetical protein